MRLVKIISSSRCAVLGLAWLALCARPAGAQTNVSLSVAAAGFTLATPGLGLADTDRTLPYNQSALKQSSEPARLGPDPKIPYFTVRFALPIPPENATNQVAALTGLDPAVFTHNHSPGLAILPNGDTLAVWFSTPPGESENATNTSFIQARLRHGAEEWDLPELFFQVRNFNNQSGLLWQDGQKTWFFGGGRGISNWVPFKIATSTNNGATWALSLPQLDQPASAYEAQPITSAFRAPDGAIYFAMDGLKATSFLWRSPDEGVHWQQLPGRTGGRHSTIVPLDDRGNLLSIGGKNASVDGWSPENRSTNWGESWSTSTASPFPPLGSAQRPSLIRLADGNLFFVSDAYLHKLMRPPPAGWQFGNGCFAAISTNQGVAWHIKPLPVQLPEHERGTNGTLGYVTTRQAPNGVIHILTTETQPCLDYELNEAWMFSEAGDIAPENSGGSLKEFSETYPNGAVRSQWRARICPNGRYLLDGPETDYYESGAKQHEVTYVSGRKTGTETFWAATGIKQWSWLHDLKNNRAYWTQFWPNGRKKSQSAWSTRPRARDLNRTFFGLVADGPAVQWDENGRVISAVRFSHGVYQATMEMSRGSPAAN